MDHVADASAMVSPRLDKRPIADAATTDAASEAITSHPDEGVNASEGNTAVGECAASVAADDASARIRLTILRDNHDRQPRADAGAADAAVASQPASRFDAARGPTT